MLVVAMGKLAPETCQLCGKAIKGSARANVLDDKILCTPCWCKLDDARQWSRPATEPQVAYARDLGLQFPSSITKQEMCVLLSRTLDYEENSAAPTWLVDRAVAFGLHESARYAGCRQLYDLIFEHLRKRDDELAAWFVEHVAGDLSRNRQPIASVTIETVARSLASNPKFMKSVRRYSGADLIEFGTKTDAEGWTSNGGSRTTFAYRAATEQLSV